MTKFKQQLPKIELMFGKVKTLIHEMEIPRIGWEMDNYAWVCEMNDGSIKSFTTSHGCGVYEMSINEIVSEIRTIQDSISSLIIGLSYIQRIDK